MDAKRTSQERGLNIGGREYGSAELDVRRAKRLRMEALFLVPVARFFS
jgi:hypothetical protein